MYKLYYYGDFYGYFSSEEKAKIVLLDIIDNEEDIDYKIEKITDIDVDQYKYYNN